MLKPKVSDAAINVAMHRLDSISNDIKAGKFTFDDATSYLSDDKDTKNNHGLMMNVRGATRTSHFLLSRIFHCKRS